MCSDDILLPGPQKIPRHILMEFLHDRPSFRTSGGFYWLQEQKRNVDKSISGMQV